MDSTQRGGRCEGLIARASSSRFSLSQLARRLTRAGAQHTLAPPVHLGLGPTPRAAMERLPTELLAHILRTDEDPAASYTSSAFKRHQAGLRKLCTVSRCLCRVARPLVWRVVVVETDKQAASLNGLLSSPSSSDLAAFPVALAAVQRDPEETQARGLNPDPLVATTVTRLVAKLPDLEQLYLVGFGPSKVKSTRVDGKIGLDFSSSGPLRSASLFSSSSSPSAPSASSRAHS